MALSPILTMFIHRISFLPTLVLAGLSVSLLTSPLRADENKACAPTSSTATTQGGLLPGETRDQKRERLVQGIEAQVGALTPAQKTHILAVLASAGDEMAAARENTALTADQQSAVVRRVHGEISTRISAALTEAQQIKMKASWTGGRDSSRANETTEQRRERLMQPYTSLTDLTVKQKSAVLLIADAAFQERDAIRTNTALTEAQKRTSMHKTYVDADAKVEALLTQEQRTQWLKVKAERRTRFTSNSTTQPAFAAR